LGLCQGPDGVVGGLRARDRSGQAESERVRGKD
jgi:hypothetical protein